MHLQLRGQQTLPWEQPRLTPALQRLVTAVFAPVLQPCCQMHLAAVTVLYQAEILWLSWWVLPEAAVWGAEAAQKQCEKLWRQLTRPAWAGPLPVRQQGLLHRPWAAPERTHCQQPLCLPLHDIMFRQHARSYSCPEDSLCAYAWQCIT